MRNFTLILLLALALNAPTNSFALPSNDFDTDGTSDLLGVTPSDGGILTWQVRYSSTGESSTFTDLGSLGNHLAPGRWRSSTVERAVIEPGDSGDVKVTLDDETSVSIDAVSSTVVTGADFDGSGLNDIAVVKKSGSRLSWKIYFNPFSGTPTQSSEILFGGVNDKPFFFSKDGTTDLLAALNPKKKLISYRSHSSATVTRLKLPSIFPFTAAPLPVAAKEGGDILGFSRIVGKQTLLHFLKTNGGRGTTGKIGANGTAVVGNFDAANEGEEIAVHDGTTLRAFNPFKKKRSTTAFTSQIIVDDININTISNDFSGEPGSEPGQCVQMNPNDGSKIGFVWKPNSDTTYYAVAVLPGQFYGNVEKVLVLKTDNTLIKQLQFTGCGNPDSTGMRCNYKDFALTGADYARTYGAIVLKVEQTGGGCKTYRIDNPARRID